MAKFLATCEGQYYSGPRNQKIEKRFKDEAFIVHNMKDALHTVQRTLLDERLRSKYPDYAGWRTCTIVDIKAVKEEFTPTGNFTKPIEEMSLSELVIFGVEHDLPIKADEYGSVAQARRAMKDAMDDKYLQQRQKEEIEADTRRKKEAQIAGTPKSSTIPDPENLDEPLISSDPEPETLPKVSGVVSEKDASAKANAASDLF